MAARKKRKVLAIFSPKGGAGKTVTAANIAAALATTFGKKILLIDTNVTNPSLGLHFNILYPKVTINDVLGGEFSLSDAIYHYTDNLDIIPASLTLKKERAFTPENEIQEMVYHYDILLSQVANEYDLIILDTTPGFSADTLISMKVADILIFVTNPDYPSLVACTKAVEYAKKMKVLVKGIVLNKVRQKSYELSPKEIEKALRVQVLQTIPFDTAIIKSIAQRKPVVLYKPRSQASLAYKKLVANLIEEKYHLTLGEKISSLFHFFSF